MLATGVLLAFTSNKTTTAPTNQPNSNNALSNDDYLNGQSNSSGDSNPTGINEANDVIPLNYFATASPKGDILNKHSISLSSISPENNDAMISTCITDGYVSCSLLAKTGEKTITIASKVADANGNAIFEWSAGQFLSPGNWEVYLEVKNKEDQTLSSNSDHLDITQ